MGDFSRKSLRKRDWVVHGIAEMENMSWRPGPKESMVRVLSKSHHRTGLWAFTMVFNKHWCRGFPLCHYCVQKLDITGFKLDSLITCDLSSFFPHGWTNHLSSFLKCLFKLFVHNSYYWIVFSYYWVVRVLYVFEILVLSHIANIFYQYVAYLFISWECLLVSKSFKLMRSNLLI